jgi:hypothetical protein
MHDLRCQYRDPAVIVHRVVPGEKRHAELRRFFDGTEPRRLFRSILHRFELRLRKRSVVRHVRATVRLCYPKVHHQFGHRFAGHRAAPISVDRQLTFLDLLLLTCLRDQFARNLLAFTLLQRPSDDATDEYVQDHA